MIAKQTVFLTEDRSTVVPEGDPKAKFLLVREGNEISDALVEKHDCADLVNKAAKGSAKPEAKTSDTPPPKKARK